MLGERHHRHRPRAAVRDVEVLGVPADVQPVGAGAGPHEAPHLEALGVDQPDAALGHVGDVERRAVRGELHVLGHAVMRRQVDDLADLAPGQVHGHQVAGELAAGQEGRAVDGEVRVVDAAAGHVHRLAQLEGLGVPEVEPVQPFRHDQRGGAVRGEVQVVGVLDLDRLARLPGRGVDRRERVAVVVVDPQRLQIPRGHDVLRAAADPEVPDDPVGLGVDHTDRAALAVGHVDQRGEPRDDGAEHAGPVVGVDVRDLGLLGAGVRHRRGDGRGLRRHGRQLGVPRLDAPGTGGHEQRQHGPCGEEPDGPPGGPCHPLRACPSVIPPARTGYGHARRETVREHSNPRLGCVYLCPAGARPRGHNARGGPCSDKTVIRCGSASGRLRRRSRSRGPQAAHETAHMSCVYLRGITLVRFRSPTAAIPIIVRLRVISSLKMPSTSVTPCVPPPASP